MFFKARIALVAIIRVRPHLPDFWGGGYIHDTLNE
jgi:hypothetical protein